MSTYNNPILKPVQLTPTSLELRNWLIGTIRHAQNIEYYLETLQIGNNDPQRPHDLIGEGNKFEWEVARGFALQYRDSSKEFFEMHVRPSLTLHRAQTHHQQWNKPNISPSADAMKLGATDAICSLIEPDRLYQGGIHTDNEIAAIILQNPDFQKDWLREVHQDMRKIQRPNLFLIENLAFFPNIGISKNTYDTMKSRLDETLKEFRERGYDV